MARPLSLQSRSLAAAGLVLAGFLGLAFFALDRAFYDAAESALRDRLQGYLYSYLAGSDTTRSGALIPPEGEWARPPVALMHGDEDGVVPVELSIQAAATLTGAGIDNLLHISPGTGHGIAPDSLAFAGQFLLRQFGGED